MSCIQRDVRPIGQTGCIAEPCSQERRRRSQRPSVEYPTDVGAGWRRGGNLSVPHKRPMRASPSRRYGSTSDPVTPSPGIMPVPFPSTVPSETASTKIDIDSRPVTVSTMGTVVHFSVSVHSVDARDLRAIKASGSGTHRLHTTHRTFASTLEPCDAAGQCSFRPHTDLRLARRKNHNWCFPLHRLNKLVRPLLQISAEAELM